MLHVFEFLPSGLALLDGETNSASNRNPVLEVLSLIFCIFLLFVGCRYITNGAQANTLKNEKTK